MRIVAARINHETNTFSPIATDLAAFSPLWGADALAEARRSNTALGAFAAFADARGAQLAVPVAAMANPSGRVTDAAFAAMTDALCAAVAAAPCDAILLDLHGALVTESIDDGDGEIIARVRALAPGVPIGVALDLHGNISSRMVADADVVVGFKTYPHVDMRETGEHVVHLVARMLDEGLHPRSVVCHPPQLAHTLRMNTGVAGAMADLVTAARAFEMQPGILAATVFGGFSLADVAEAGASIVVVGETEALATAAARDLAATLWDRRRDLFYAERPLADSLAEAACLPAGTGPVLLLDHGDNCMSGGTCDVTDVLAAALERGFDGILAGPFCDPALVAELTRAGVGATVEVALGNKLVGPVFERRPPLRLAGTVTAIGDGSYVIEGPTYTGMRCTMGRAAVLRTAQATVLVTEQAHEPWDFGVFGCVGLDPREANILILKSRMYCRPCFEPIARGVVECASAGISSSNYALFPFGKLARPIFPLDADAVWTSDR